MTKLVTTNGTISNQDRIMNEQLKYYKILCTKSETFPERECNEFLNEVIMPQLNDEEKNNCDKIFNILELGKALQQMKNDSNRLKEVVNKLVHQDQCGYISGRNTALILRTPDGIIEHTSHQYIPGAMITSDYTKAYDTISKKYI